MVAVHLKKIVKSSGEHETTGSRDTRGKLICVFGHKALHGPFNIFETPLRAMLYSAVRIYRTLNLPKITIGILNRESVKLY